MNDSLDDVFLEYEQLLRNADALFARVAAEYPAQVSCRKGCGDCCHALFDLSLVEAMHINKIFRENFDYGKERSDILENASKADRALTKIKRDLYRSEKAGEDVKDIFGHVSELRLRCPLLDSRNECRLYSARPITCRLYGIPLEIDGKAHVCGLSRFDEGRSYPTVKLGKIQKRLDELSLRIARIQESPLDFTDIYVPVSMALLTKYDDVYFGKRKSDE